METLTLNSPTGLKPNQEMENLPLPLVVNASEIKTTKKFIKGKNGAKYKLTVCCVKSPKLILIKINDEYARCIGFPHRIGMLDKFKQSSNASKELFHEPTGNIIYTILKADKN